MERFLWRWFKWLIFVSYNSLLFQAQVTDLRQIRVCAQNNKKFLTSSKTIKEGG